MTFIQGRLTSREPLRLLNEAVTNGLECSLELINYKKSGQSFNNFLQLIPLRTECQITHYLGVLEDISPSSIKRKEVEYKVSAELNKEDGLERKFIAILPSHSDTSNQQDQWVKKREDLLSFLKSSSSFSSLGAIPSKFSAFSSMMNSPDFWEEAAILVNEVMDVISYNIE